MFNKVIPLIVWLATSSSGAVHLAERILNGEDSAPGQFPSIVSLRCRGFHICGGSIIDETHILTAAHCLLASCLPAELSIQYGVTEITNGNEAPNLIQVLNYTIHPNFEQRKSNITVFGIFNLGDTVASIKNDVAILKLAERIVFSDTVKPATLPEASEAIPVGCNATAVGWGFYNNDHVSMTHLQTVNLLVNSDEDCEAAYSQLTANENVYTQIILIFSQGYQTVINRSHNFCAKASKKGICQGDSGGPLFCDGKLIGVASLIKAGCTEARPFPDMFEKVSMQVPWILENV